VTTIIIVRSRPGQATERPYLARANPISYGRKFTYRTLWTNKRADALRPEPALADALLAWLRASRLTAGYQYDLADGAPDRPDAEEQARRQRLVLEALAELGTTGAPALAERCGLGRYQVARILKTLAAAGAAAHSASSEHNTWRATKYGHWLVARRRLVAQVAGRPGWVVQEAGDA